MSNVKLNPSTARNKEIIAAVVRGAKAGKTNKEVAAELEMAESSFQTTTSNLRKVLGEAGFELPKLVRTGSGSANKAEQAAEAAEFARGLLAELNATEDADETGEGEADENLELGDDS